jgi:ATP-dependent Clp protease ATP-binding subunit ClpC
MSDVSETRELTMPKINIYVPDDLADAVRDAGVPVSAICQRALELAVRRVTAIRAVAASAPHDDVLPDPPVVNFTRRATTVLESAHRSAGAVPGSQVHTEHLLVALLADDNMAVRVLCALEITPRQVEAEVRRRVAAGQGAASAAESNADLPWLSPGVAKAIELAGTESSGLGNGYVGSEHLLLGLIAEPDGLAGGVLRSLGADLRVVRRTVAAALAGWGAGVAANEERTAGQATANPLTTTPPIGSADPADQMAGLSAITGQLSAAIKAELAPVLARLERLERAAAG